METIASTLRDVNSIAADPAHDGTFYATRYYARRDGFVAVLDGMGLPLRMSTYLGGSADDEVVALALGRDGRLYVVGSTSSADFPGVRPADSRQRGVFVSVLTQARRVFPPELEKP